MIHWHIIHIPVNRLTDKKALPSHARGKHNTHFLRLTSILDNSNKLSFATLTMDTVGLGEIFTNVNYKKNSKNKNISILWKTLHMQVLQLMGSRWEVEKVIVVRWLIGRKT